MNAFVMAGQTHRDHAGRATRSSPGNETGAIYVASQTGRLLCPAPFVCRRGWRIAGRWTDMLIPWPFTTVYLVTGQPITMPPDLSRGELGLYMSRIQIAMDELTDQAERFARGETDQIEFAAPMPAQPAAT